MRVFWGTFVGGCYLNPSSPLRAWALQHVERPAREAWLAAQATRAFFCEYCDGSRLDQDEDVGACQECEGTGRAANCVGNADRRGEFDRQLRSRGLDPAAFDDYGDLIREPAPP